MRILWMSTAPFCGSGYGTVTKEVCERIAKHYDVGIYAFYGLKGGTLDWNGIPVFPNNENDYGNKNLLTFARHFSADVVISLMDVWVLQDYVMKQVKWVPYFPIDHDPIPPIVENSIKPRFDAITMSEFGHRKALEAGIESTYIPHGVDTKLFKPNAKIRNQVREAMGIQDKFVVGTVAANIGERKNYKAMLQAFAKFHKEYPDTAFVCHTNPLERKGMSNMAVYCKELGIENDVIFPTQDDLQRGYSKEEMVALYNAMDCFFLLTRGEGFGVPTIEAQACGLPVILTDCTTSEELCGSGWLVDVVDKDWTYQSSYQFLADVDHAVKRLETAYESNGTDSLKKKAREFALNYDYDLIVEKYWLPYLKKLEAKVDLLNQSTTKES